MPGVAWEGLCAAVTTVPGRLVSMLGWPAAAAGGAPAARRGAATNMATMAATNTAAGCMLQEARRDVGRESWWGCRTLEEMAAVVSLRIESVNQAQPSQTRAPSTV